jgi:hypothetical protein
VIDVRLILIVSVQLLEWRFYSPTTNTTPTEHGSVMK